jgi:threonine/homoserine efflux transporter RhtA
VASRRRFALLVILAPAFVAAVLNAVLGNVLHPPFWVGLLVLPVAIGVPVGITAGLLFTRAERRRG